MIVSNQIKCNHCGDAPFSAHRHDYRSCGCGRVAVDGGQDYLRRTFQAAGDFTDQSIELPKELVDTVTAAVKWGKDTGRNEYGTALAVFRALRDYGVNVNEFANAHNKL